MSVKLLIEHDLEFLSLIGGSRGSSESTLVVKMPHCLKSHVAAQINQQQENHHGAYTKHNTFSNFLCFASLCAHLRTISNNINCNDENRIIGK